MEVMTDIKFDDNGNLAPFGMSVLDIEFFYSFFVENFPESETRKELFKNYVKYIEDLFITLDADWFFQYIGGSFVTNKQNPEDIDVINCIKAKDLGKFEEIKREEILKKLFKRYKTNKKDIKGKSKENYLIDAYLVLLYPKQHPKYEASMKRLFGGQKGLTEYTRDGSKRGFVKIIFNKETRQKLAELAKNIK